MYERQKRRVQNLRYDRFVDDARIIYGEWNLFLLAVITAKLND